MRVVIETDDLTLTKTAPKSDLVSDSRILVRLLADTIEAYDRAAGQDNYSLRDHLVKILQFRMTRQ